MPELQSLHAALSVAIAALSGVVVHLYRENQSLHSSAKDSQAQMLRVLVVVEKALDDFLARTERMEADSQEIREAAMLMKERQATILAKISATSPTSSDKSQKNLPR